MRRHQNEAAGCKRAMRPGGYRIDNLAPITLPLRLHKRAALYRGIRVGTRIAAGTGVHVECAKRREGKG
jgi:hypothetical protein